MPYPKNMANVVGFSGANMAFACIHVAHGRSDLVAVGPGSGAAYIWRRPTATTSNPAAPPLSTQQIRTHLPTVEVPKGTLHQETTTVATLDLDPVAAPVVNGGDTGDSEKIHSLCNI